ncbi:MAG: phospho-N-acetylmuramoyl-pentapeptide-transferase [Dinghuibacter sp.]|nr:phospho-N-acetylmuramoyl-pentapeptide-transferase [Dinghuibacter sp.]
MLYHLYEWLKDNSVFKGLRLFQDISFRAIAAIILSLVISAIVGKFIIRRLSRMQIGESVRELGLQGEQTKKGTPTMGGIIILLAILIPTLLFANLTNIYVIILLLTTVWCGAIGFVDDYLKIRAKRIAQKKGEAYKKADADGLAGRFKIAGQVSIGIIVGSMLYFNNNVQSYREFFGTRDQLKQSVNINDTTQVIAKQLDGKEHLFVKVNKDEPVTTIPFVKSHEFNYAKLLPKSWRGSLTWLLYILVVTFIITAVSNGANITDGLDGLATGVSAIIGAALGIFVYVGGNFRFAEYLNVLYIPNMGELSIFMGAFIGACIGFLWYNAYPAQVFMGDTGSLALGGIIGTLAIIVKKELLIPVFCGVFFVENLSVIIQRYYFKYTKKKYGEGRRVFLMAPLHHHYQKLGYHESKIAVRFWIVTVLLVVVSVVTLKIR